MADNKERAAALKLREERRKAREVRVDERRVQAEARTAVTEKG